MTSRVSSPFRRRAAALVVLGALLAAPVVLPVHAQGPAPRPKRGWMRPAKWIALGAAAGIAGYAVTRTGAANDAYDSLRDACSRAPSGCTLNGGAYADPALERLYDRAVGNDRQAQVAIVGGQSVLLVAATLFVLDLREGRGPADIPYPATGSRSCAAARCFLIGRLAF